MGRLWGNGVWVERVWGNGGREGMGNGYVWGGGCGGYGEVDRGIWGKEGKNMDLTQFNIAAAWI